jgi:hypothetical protein
MRDGGGPGISILQQGPDSRAAGAGQHAGAAGRRDCRSRVLGCSQHRRQAQFKSHRAGIY